MLHEFLKPFTGKGLNPIVSGIFVALPLVLSGPLNGDFSDAPDGTLASAIQAQVAHIAAVEKQAVAAVPTQLAPGACDTPPPITLAASSQVLEQHKIKKNGRTLILQSILPPPPKAPLPPAPPPVETPAMPEKPDVTLFLSVTVYDHVFTQIRWFKNGQEYKALLNIDFTLFRGVERIETPEAVYSFCLGIGEEVSDSAQDLGQLPQKLGQSPLTGLDLTDLAELVSTGPQGLVLDGNPDGIEQTAEYQALPLILAHYTAHEQEMRWAAALQKAQNLARQRWQEAHPPGPRPSTILQSSPVKSTLYPDTSR